MTLLEKLRQAEDAYHRYQTGTAVVELDKDGRSVKFNSANIHQLRNYIEELKSQLGMTNHRRRPPAGVMC